MAGVRTGEVRAGLDVAARAAAAVLAAPAAAAGVGGALREVRLGVADLRVREVRGDLGEERKLRRAAIQGV